MLKPPSKKALRVLGYLYFLVFIAVAFLNAQGAESAAAAEPGSRQEAIEMMGLGSQMNGLTAGNLPSWHIRVEFKLLDEKGNVADSGSWEEFWAGESQFKRSFTGTAFEVSEFGTPNGLKRIGSSAWPASLMWDMRKAIVDPLPREASLQNMDLETKDIKAKRLDGGKMDLVCFTLKAKPTATTARLYPDAVYCFDSKNPFLRTRGIFAAGEDTTANNPTLFHDHFVPGDLTILLNGKLALTAHVEIIEDLKSDDDSLFDVPAEAKAPVAETVGLNISTAEARGLLIKQVPPEYPAVAKAARVEGVVVLQALIGKDGQVQELAVESGSPLLQQAALDAVHQWIYRPYMINGKPKPVYTKINVVFTLTR
jgi:TonB family protein